MSLCKDCRWVILDSLGDPYYTDCGHPSAVTTSISPVDGSQETIRSRAGLFRSQGIGACGPDGTLWQPKHDPPVDFVEGTRWLGN